MGKTLLRTVNDHTDVNENTATVTSVDENTALSELMQEMRSVLEEAAKDLVQPRNEVIEKLLKKALH